MKSILIYTFRTFPYIKQLNTITKNIFVLGKLKEDISKLEEILGSEQYDHIVGIAKSDKESVFETKGVNKFNKGIILSDGKDKYFIDYPRQGYLTLGINNSYTTSFCNWAIYNVAKIVEDNKLLNIHSFVHIRENDIPILKQYLESK